MSDRLSSLLENGNNEQDFTKIFYIGVSKFWKGKKNYSPFYTAENLNMRKTCRLFLKWDQYLMLAPPGQNESFTHGRIHHYIEKVHDGEGCVTSGTITNINKKFVELILTAISFNLLVDSCGRHGTEKVVLNDITGDDWSEYYKHNYRILLEIMTENCCEYF